jgi:hypothetical protein
MKSGRKKGQRLLEQDLKMRAEGYVTAWEVAEALGVDTTTIHYRLRKKMIEGIGVPVMGSKSGYTRWYVDVCALMRQYPSEAPDVLRKALSELCALVKVAKKAG